MTAAKEMKVLCLKYANSEISLKPEEAARNDQSSQKQGR